MAVRKQIAFRTTDETEAKLTEIEKFLGLKRQDVLNGLINSEYDRITGNPQLMAIMEQMTDLKTKLENYGKGEQI